jgi:acetyltransferase
MSDRVRDPAPLAVDGAFASDPARPGGPARRVDEVPWHGEVIVIRRLGVDDEQLYREFTARLDPEDVRMRFFGPQRELTHEELLHRLQIDDARELALAAVRMPNNGHPEILGIVRAAAEGNGIDAELGIIVRSDIKAEGLGWLLLHKLIAGMAGRGPKRLVAYVLHENFAMCELARASGFVRDLSASDGQALCFVLDLREAAPVGAASPCPWPATNT